MKKRTLFVLVMLLGAVAGAWAAQVNYLDLNGQTQTVEATPITSATETLATGWYSISGRITNDNRLRVADGADVNIILEEDAYFTNAAGITCNEGSNLTIWAQTKDVGTWTINDPYYYFAAIGADVTESDVNNSGVITINGGVIKTTVREVWTQPGSGTYMPMAAAIGGSGVSNGAGGTGTVIINGGVIDVEGGFCAAAIGGGCYAPGYVTINGGTIEAYGSYGGVYSGERGYGIGGGYGSTGSTISLNYNGDVSIKSNNYRGSVALLKSFYDGSRVIDPCVLENGAGLENKTLVPGGDFAAWCEGNSTLYFARAAIPAVGSTYKGNTVTAVWSGAAVNNAPLDPLNNILPGWNVMPYRTKITSVVFDPSFADARPKCTASWFWQMSNLSNITGLQYLNTSQVTCMYRMFYQCYGLRTLDLSTFDLSSLTDISYMFFESVYLTTIYSNVDWNTDKLVNSENMFYSCNSLVGAVAHDYRKYPEDATMANPKGYFTGKWALNIPSSFEHGTVTCDKDWAYTNETVTLTVMPEEGYKLESLTIETIDDGEPSGAPLLAPRKEAVNVTPGDEPGTYTFKMLAAPVNINAVFSEEIVTGIEDLNAAQPKTGRRYNIMGQPVGKDYKGIVIQNGKKVIVR